MSGQRDKRPIQDGQDVAAVCGRVEVHFPGGLSGCLDSNSLRSLDAALDTRSAICPTALSFLGTPYLWGGTTPFGFDCSGLVQRAYSAAGIVLPRDAYQQAASPLGKPVPIGAALEPRDLVFFRGARDPLNRGITHVGMMIDGTRMIHASGRTGVVVQELTDGEILESHTYRGAWRLI
jgi:cell wall-associated NlpC family hydrolase